MKIVTRILDSVYGRSAAGVRVVLARAADDGWTTIADTRTGANGSVDQVTAPLQFGIYRIAFWTDSYFATLGEVSAFPEIMAVFRVNSESPTTEIVLTLSPNSYSVYVGSSNHVESGSIGHDPV